MIATETRSTSPSSSKLPKSVPPPKSQMSLPGCFLSAETVCDGLSETVTPRQSACLQGSREDVGLDAWRRSALVGPRDLVRLSPHENDVEAREHGVKVDLWIDDDPVGFTRRASDVAVKAHRDRIHDLAHTPPLDLYC